MRISRSWLSDYVDFEDLSNGDLENLITTKVAEVDGVDVVGHPVERAMLCAIVCVRPHPAKDTLSVVEVSTGDSTVTVVSGARNVREGGIAVYMPPGGRIRCRGAERFVSVECREISRVMSAGMLVSEAELDIGAEEGELLYLDDLKGAVPGAKLAHIIGGADAVIVIDNKSLTHRPDLWSHIGFARELSAILGRPLKRDPDRWADDRESGKRELAALRGVGECGLSIAIDPRSKCRRFAGLELKNVHVQAAPLWIRRRLHAIGAGVRNILVDLSNYCMHDLGQPNHAYDADTLTGGRVCVRRGNQGEPFLGLDGEERTLSRDDIVIGDASGAIALGGVIGGAKCSIRETTRRILLESANFDPTAIRMMTKRHALRTDASNRFEKSLSPYQVPLALHRFVELLRAEQPRIEIVGGVVEEFVDPPSAVYITVSNDYIRERLGESIPDPEIDRILTALQCRVTEAIGPKRKVHVPYFRASRDVTIPDDLVEEVGRMYGYDRIPELAPTVKSEVPKYDRVKMFEYEIADLLVGAGFSEISNYSFTSRERSEALGFPMEWGVELANPIDASLTHIRTTLVPGMIDAIVQNARFRDAISIFELGRVYEQGELPEHEHLRARRKTWNAPAKERRLLAIGYTIAPGGSDRHPFEANLYALLEVVDRVVRLASRRGVRVEEISPEVKPKEGGTSRDFTAYRPWMHPARAGTIVVHERSVGVLAEVNPLIAEDLPRRTVIAELDVELLLEADPEPVRFTPLPRFPDSLFEMSVIMPERTAYRELEKVIRDSVPSELLRRIEVLDVYSGKPLKTGEKSISVKLHLGADNRTLSGEELRTLQEGLMRRLGESPFTLRAR